MNKTYRHGMIKNLKKICKSHDVDYGLFRERLKMKPYKFLKGDYHVIIDLIEAHGKVVGSNGISDYLKLDCRDFKSIVARTYKKIEENRYQII